MRIQKTIKFLILISMTAILSGCMSLVMTFEYNQNSIYAGTKGWAKTYAYPFAHPEVEQDINQTILVYIAGLIDMPLSFVMDTLLLPRTIPCSLDPCRKPSVESKTSEELESKASNKSLKAQPAAAGTYPTGAASQHTAGGYAP